MKPAPTPAHRRRWAMFAVLLVGSFLPPLDFFIVNVALPSIQAEFGASASAEQLVISSYAALHAVTLITGGRLAWSPWALIAGRALQGVTAAIMAPQALASIQAIFPEAEKPRALGLYGAVFGLASVIGQALGGILISLDLFGIGWRAIFLVNLPVAILVIVLGLPLLKETRAPRTSKLDPGGTVLSIVTLGALIVPLIEGREAGWPWWSWLSLAAAPLLAWCFWHYESRLARAGGSPLLDPAALRAPGLGRALAIALLFYTVAAFFLLFSVYLQNALQVSALDAGLVFLPFGAGYLLGPLTTPYGKRLLGDWVNPVGMGTLGAGFVALAWLVATTPIWAAPAPTLLATILFVIGLGQGVALPSLMRIITGRVKPAWSGMIAGVASSTLQLSTALSVALIGGIFYTIRGAHEDPATITHAFIVAILCIAACLAIGAVLGVTLAWQRGAATTGRTSGV